VAKFRQDLDVVTESVRDRLENGAVQMGSCVAEVQTNERTARVWVLDWRLLAKKVWKDDDSIRARANHCGLRVELRQRSLTGQLALEPAQ
jgi:hypothetical protein